MKCPHCGEDIGNCEYLDPYVDKCGNRPKFKITLVSGVELKVCKVHTKTAVVENNFIRIEKL